MNNIDKSYIWEREVIDEVGRILEITNSDAQGYIQARTFTIAQSWGKGLTPKATAELLAEKIKADYTSDTD